MYALRCTLHNHCALKLKKKETQKVQNWNVYCATLYYAYIHTVYSQKKKCMEIHLAKYMILQRESITTYILVIQYITQKINV